MKPTLVATHLFVHDGQSWPDRLRRCTPPCGLPESNRCHLVPDRSEEQDEHRRRAGESEGA